MNQEIQKRSDARCQVSEREEELHKDVVNETKGLMNFKSYSGPLGLTKVVSAVVIGTVLPS